MEANEVSIIRPVKRANIFDVGQHADYPQVWTLEERLDYYYFLRKDVSEEYKSDHDDVADRMEMNKLLTILKTPNEKYPFLPLSDCQINAFLAYEVKKRVNKFWLSMIVKNAARLYAEFLEDTKPHFPMPEHMQQKLNNAFLPVITDSYTETVGQYITYNPSLKGLFLKPKIIETLGFVIVFRALDHLIRHDSRVINFMEEHKAFTTANDVISQTVSMILAGISHNHIQDDPLRKAKAVRSSLYRMLSITNELAPYHTFYQGEWQIDLAWLCSLINYGPHMAIEKQSPVSYNQLCFDGYASTPRLHIDNYHAKAKVPTILDLLKHGSVARNAE